MVQEIFEKVWSRKKVRTQISVLQKMSKQNVDKQ